MACYHFTVLVKLQGHVRQGTVVMNLVLQLYQLGRNFLAFQALLAVVAGGNGIVDIVNCLCLTVRSAKVKACWHGECEVAYENDRPSLASSLVGQRSRVACRVCSYDDSAVLSVNYLRMAIGVRTELRIELPWVSNVRSGFRGGPRR